MNYISDYLCHFVGRSRANDDERFDLLVKIIKEKQLKANLDTPDNPSLYTSSNYKGDRLGEILERCDCVCFCDIPDDMLEIHTSKYSRFGIGFTKPFLASQGARPVMYVPLSARMKEPCFTDTPKDNPIDYYLYLNKLSNNLNPMLMLLNAFFKFDNQIRQLINAGGDLKRSVELYDGTVLKELLDGHAHQMMFSETVAWATQCSYVKVFDETLAEDDPDNYYMEREWRSLKSVDFSVNDIQKVYLPSQQYRERFMAEFPDYAGGFWLFDEQ